MMPPRNPDRETMHRIIDEEAIKRFVSARLIRSGSTSRRASAARAEAIRKILAVTGCSCVGLAEVWGCSAETVRAAQRPRAGGPALYDANTRQRLAWAHGEDRAAQIVAGKDAPTEADIASWRRLGQRSAAA